METKKYRSRIKAWAIFFWCIDTSIADTLTALLLPNRSQSYVKCQRKLNLYERMRIQTFIPKIFGFQNKIVISERLNHFFEVENTYITMGVRLKFRAVQWERILWIFIVKLWLIWSRQYLKRVCFWEYVVRPEREAERQESLKGCQGESRFGCPKSIFANFLV